MSANALASSPGPRRRSTRVEAEADAAGRHRLDVVAASVPDVVRSAGGWLADRALAGWDVNVFVPDTDDVAPLRILGVTPHSHADVLPTRRNPRPPTAMAVSADMMSTDSTVRDQLVADFAREIPEVTVWGAAVPHGHGRTVPVGGARSEHRGKSFQVACHACGRPSTKVGGAHRGVPCRFAARHR